jgi:4-amino-4-deoxy-L-arabinose transferase-like glycosyltransferase
MRLSWWRSPSFRLAALAALLAFAFLGSRGIWDPDEGRYTNVALNMLASGDWINPHRLHEVGHWTKPPLTYWAIAGSVAVFGWHTWAARLPAALAYLLCAWLVRRIGRRLQPGSEDPATLAYLLMLFTAGPAQLITTDYVLAACEALAMWGFVEARFGAAEREYRWNTLAWIGLALAFLAKGPPGLLPLLPMLAYDLWMPGGRRRHLLTVAGAVVFVLVALPWYAAVIANNPGLLEYFIGDETYNRIVTDRFGRNGQWYGWLLIYGPTLLLGTLPWTPALLRWAKTLPATLRGWWGRPQARAAAAPRVLLVLWLLLPLAVFCLSRSRLPLYLLPLFAPLALLVAQQWRDEGRGPPRPWLIAAWVLLILLLRIGLAHWPTHKDAAMWAAELRTRVDFPVNEVVFVDDMARYGLHLELGAQVEKISLDPLPQPRFNPEFDDFLADELAEREPDVLWICKQERWPELQARIAALGYRATMRGAPFLGRTIFTVKPAASLPAPADADR